MILSATFEVCYYQYMDSVCDVIFGRMQVNPRKLISLTQKERSDWKNFLEKYDRTQVTTMRLP